VRVRRQQFGKHAVAGGDVEHVAGFKQRQCGACQRFPGAAGRVVAFHVAGHRIGPVLVGGAHHQHAGHAFGVLAQQRVVAAGAQRLPQAAQRGVEAGLVKTVIGRDAGAAVADQAGFLQPGQVRGHARLRQAGDRGQLGHGQLLALEQGEQTYAGGVGQHLQARGPGFEVHPYLPIAI
jgi:hypothetical protein